MQAVVATYGVHGCTTEQLYSTIGSGILLQISNLQVRIIIFSWPTDNIPPSQLAFRTSNLKTNLKPSWKIIHHKPANLLNSLVCIVVIRYYWFTAKPRYTTKPYSLDKPYKTECHHEPLKQGIPCPNTS